MMGGGEAPTGMNVEKVKSQMHSLALGEAMSAAAENYKKVGPCLQLGAHACN